MLERLGGGSSTQIGEPFVDWSGEPGKAEHFTPAGWDLVGAARIVAHQGATYLDDVLARSTEEPDVELLKAAQQFLAVATCALDGIDREADVGGLNGPWIATGLHAMLTALLVRAARKEEVAHV
jgi:hypothetical protein